MGVSMCLLVVTLPATYPLVTLLLAILLSGVATWQKKGGQRPDGEQMFTYRAFLFSPTANGYTIGFGENRVIRAVLP
jgi:hypothetical protein